MDKGKVAGRLSLVWMGPRSDRQLQTRHDEAALPGLAGDMDLQGQQAGPVHMSVQPTRTLQV